MRYKGFGRVGRIYERIKGKIDFLKIAESARTSVYEWSN